MSDSKTNFLNSALSEGNASTALVNSANVDLSNCDREQIHLVNAIQPHGALLALDEAELLIVKVSANTESFLGIPAERLLGQPVDVLLGDDNALAFRTCLASKNLTGVLAHIMTLSSLPRRKECFHVFGNRIDGLLLLEFERAEAFQLNSQNNAFNSIHDTIQILQQATSYRGFLDCLAEKMRALVGYDRVLVYQFDTDGSGEVVAESLYPDLEPYLGLHFPASDIPAPARRLFAMSPLRHLPDVDYTPVPLLSLPSDSSNDVPVDLSYSFLRSVSVMYTGYLRNMGVRSSLVMPLLKDNKLWGLISCMNTLPKYVAYEQRIPAELLTQISGFLLNNKEDIDHISYRSKLDSSLFHLTERIQNNENLVEALTSAETNLISTLDANGVVLIFDGQYTILGNTPSQQDIEKIVVLIDSLGLSVFATHRLAHDFPNAVDSITWRGGLLSIRLGNQNFDKVIWFRPEFLQEVHWAGDPHKPVEFSEVDGEIRLRPRTSFALWKETVYGQARPWLNCELKYAEKLRDTISDTIFERARVLKIINTQMQRNIDELDTFAYAASHDLKEPLRGIHNFVEFLKLEEGDRLSEEGRRRLNTILELSIRMNNMLEALLQYARTGRDKLELRVHPIDQLISKSIELVKQIFPSLRITFDVQPSFPGIVCDELLVSIIFQNLLVNAVKYNDNDVRKVEIGCNENNNPPVFYVRDNGIGIAPGEFDNIFKLFNRAHGRNMYGGGTGVGLTIVKRAVERLSGRIWVESILGKGSTFYFTLSPEHITKEKDNG